jgi:cytidylate kinase
LLKKNVDLADEAAIVDVAKTMHLAFVCGDQLEVTLDGECISGQLALETTGNVASIIAVLPAVRAALLQKQQDFRCLPGLVADGRDMGTVVFPDAQYKVFLTASAEKRAERRYKQLIEKGIDANLPRLLHDIQERDRRDSERVTAPLAMASDAVFLDSSEMNVDAVIAEVLSLIQ